jgi:hypothetical protein
MSLRGHEAESYAGETVATGQETGSGKNQDAGWEYAKRDRNLENKYFVSN